MQGNNSPTGRTCSGNWDWKKKKEDQRRFGLVASIGYIKIVMLYINFLLGMVWFFIGLCFNFSLFQTINKCKWSKGIFWDLGLNFRSKYYFLGILNGIWHVINVTFIVELCERTFIHSLVLISFTNIAENQCTIVSEYLNNPYTSIF